MSVPTTYGGAGSKVTIREKKRERKNLALANQWVMSQHFPKNKLALGLAALAFAFAVCSWVI
jgi:hypothetical protein